MQKIKITLVPRACPHLILAARPFNPRRMRRRVTVVVLCVRVSVCYQASCYIPCLRVQSAALKVPYGVPNAWISPKTLCSPVLASFADSKLLDFSRASDSMTFRINKRYVSRAVYGMYVLLTLYACALGSRQWSPPPPSLSP